MNGITNTTNILFLIACFKFKFKSANIALVIPHPGHGNLKSNLKIQGTLSSINNKKMDKIQT